MTPEAELIRALAEDLALEILASYTPEDFEAADFTSLGKGGRLLGRPRGRARARPPGADCQGSESRRDTAGQQPQRLKSSVPAASFFLERRLFM